MYSCTRRKFKFCRKNGYVSNIFGRRIHLRGINDKNFSVRSFQERAAINAPIQSSAADIIRLAIAEHGPGNEKILCLLCLIPCTNLYPGSDINGVPASEINEIIFPSFIELIT